MKKFAKMSLVAAIAVAGFTSTASAGALEEAIKGVDISGKVRYRIEDKSGSAHQDQDVNIDVTLNVPVTDNVSFIANANLDNDDQGDNSSLAGAGDLNLDTYYFQYVNGPATVLLGTQEIPGRLTDGAIAEGIVGLYNAGAFTIGAASFYNADLKDTNGEMINSIIAMGSFGPVSLLGQYIDADDVLDAYNLKADATFGPVKAGLEYSERDLDADNNEYSTFQAYVSGSIDIVSATLAYVKTGDNGSASLDQTSDAASEFQLWQMGSAGAADLDAWAIDASVAVTDAITLRAAYADGEAGNTDLTEALGQISYKVSKNLNTYIRYSNYDVEGQDDVNRGRIEVKYTF